MLIKIRLDSCPPMELCGKENHYSNDTYFPTAISAMKKYMHGVVKPYYREI